MLVLSWGRNRQGEIGLERQIGQIHPSLIPNFEGKAVAISAGEGHSLIVNETGDVFSFGRGKEGQLGLGPSRNNEFSPRKVTALSNEYVMNVAAGAVTSYAVTASGRAYHWGLVMKSSLASFNETEEAVTSGQLTGINADQSITIEIDEESRQQVEGNVHPGASRQLRDIVRESTERWLLADDYGDTSKRDCHSLLLKIGCFRVLQSIPEPIPNTSHLKVVSVSAGYAHCMLLTEQGELFAAGYNDRGQLGLGHRISTAEFKPVESLLDLFVVQVECGQQHTICRAVNRDFAIQKNIIVGDKVGADAFIWGNGVLGQLGLGRLGTSKGRLSPIVITDLALRHPEGIINVAAGGNFTVAVTDLGQVYSWGHAEYNQHGTGGSTTDYTDPYHFFTPKEVVFDRIDHDKDPIVSVTCGSNFSLGITRHGVVYSWGWGAYGVLGHGPGQYTSQPTAVRNISKFTSDFTPIALSAGASHVLAIAKSIYCPWAKQFKLLLSNTESADIEIIIHNSANMKKFYAHAAVLISRSSYFRGFLAAAIRDMNKSRHCNEDNSGSEKEKQMIQIELESVHANDATVAGLLEYLYLDVINVSYQTRNQLAALANDLGLTQLAALASSNRPRKNVKYFHVFESTFEEDMISTVNQSMFADVIFHRMPIKSTDEGEERFRFALDADKKDGHQFSLNLDKKYNDEWSAKHGLILAHQSILTVLPYFESLFSGKFLESSHFKSTSGRLHLNLDGFEEEGIEFESFLTLVKYVYSGRIVFDHHTCDSVNSPGNLYMALLVAGNRFGLPQLVQYCERQLSLHITDYPENLENLLNFSLIYGVTRLEHQCNRLLALNAMKRV